MKYQAKNIIFLCTLAVIFFTTFNTNLFANPIEHTKIKRVIQSYEKALNGSDVNAVISVYAIDGVFMPSEKPTASGHNQIKTAYEHVFQALDLNVVFQYEKIEQDGEIAYVRTKSVGDIKLLDKGVTVKNDVHRELFVLKNEKGQWKIAQYMFNKPGKH